VAQVVEQRYGWISLAVSTVLSGTAVGSAARQVRLRVRDESGIQRDALTLDTWRDARRCQRSILQAAAKLTEAEVNDHHAKGSWHTFCA